MKYLNLTIFLLLSTVAASAQTLSNSQDLSVLQKKWRINLDSQAAADSARDAAASERRFPAIKEADETMRVLKDNQRDNVNRQRQGLPPEAPRVRNNPAVAPVPIKVAASYTYQIKVKNNGARTIKKVVWEYVFLDPKTNQSVGSRQFTSKTNLKPGETDSLVQKLPSPPTLVISAKDAGKELSGLYNEQINIKRIEYSDGTVWNADPK